MKQTCKYTSTNIYIYIYTYIYINIIWKIFRRYFSLFYTYLVGVPGHTKLGKCKNRNIKQIYCSLSFQHWFIRAQIFKGYNITFKIHQVREGLTSCLCGWVPRRHANRKNCWKRYVYFFQLSRPDFDWWQPKAVKQSNGRHQWLISEETVFFRAVACPAGLMNAKQEFNNSRVCCIWSHGTVIYVSLSFFSLRKYCSVIEGTALRYPCDQQS